jgi:sarcosine oxidase subunit alpha
MRGACDGCLARVDGVPNVMTCLVPAQPDKDVRSQNALGSRELDLLRVTDWFFPDGMNHHELLAGIPGVQDAMQIFARRVAGLGHLPEAVRAPSKATRRALDVLVVGGGPAGMAMALAASRKGRTVEVIDDGLGPGGGARGLAREDDADLWAIRESFDAAVAQGGVKLRSRTVAGAVYGKDVLVAGSEVEILEPRSLVLATGAHDGVVPFENNDLAGVLSARAACLLGAAGVSVGSKVVLLAERAGEGRGVSFADAFERSVAKQVASGAKTTVTRVGEVVGTKGASRLRGVVVREEGRERSLTADVLLVDAPRAPAYELCEQAGAKLVHTPSGYVPDASRGKIGERVWAIGEVTGMPLDAAGFLRAAEEIAGQL